MLDERFVMHQMKSMKIATRTSSVLMGVSVVDKYVRGGYLDWQLFSIMIIMALVKVGALLYFRKAN